MGKITKEIPSKMKEAMKAGDQLTLNTLRSLKTALTNAAIEKGGLSSVLDDAEELTVVRKQVKQREDSVEQFEKAGRKDLSEKERAEIVVLQQFMPEPLTEAEINAILDTVIAETGASSKKDMGNVMKLMKERTEARADGKLLARLVSARLS